jgi:hypothetical protein
MRRNSPKRRLKPASMLKLKGMKEGKRRKETKEGSVGRK